MRAIVDHRFKAAVTIALMCIALVACAALGANGVDRAYADDQVQYPNSATLDSLRTDRSYVIDALTVGARAEKDYGGDAFSGNPHLSGSNVNHYMYEDLLNEYEEDLALKVTVEIYKVKSDWENYPIESLQNAAVNSTGFMPFLAQIRSTASNAEQNSALRAAYEALGGTYPTQETLKLVKEKKASDSDWSDYSTATLSSVVDGTAAYDSYKASLKDSDDSRDRQVYSWLEQKESSGFSGARSIIQKLLKLLNNVMGTVDGETAKGAKIYDVILNDIFTSEYTSSAGVPLHKDFEAKTELDECTKVLKNHNKAFGYMSDAVDLAENSAQKILIDDYLDVLTNMSERKNENLTAALEGMDLDDGWYKAGDGLLTQEFLAYYYGVGDATEDDSVAERLADVKAECEERYFLLDGASDYLSMAKKLTGWSTSTLANYYLLDALARENEYAKGVLGRTANTTQGANDASWKAAVSKYQTMLDVVDGSNVENQALISVLQTASEELNKTLEKKASKTFTKFAREGIVSMGKDAATRASIATTLSKVSFVYTIVDTLDDYVAGLQDVAEKIYEIKYLLDVQKYAYAAYQADVTAYDAESDPVKKDGIAANALSDLQFLKQIKLRQIDDAYDCLSTLKDETLSGVIAKWIADAWDDTSLDDNYQAQLDAVLHMMICPVGGTLYSIPSGTTLTVQKNNAFEGADTYIGTLSDSNGNRKGIICEMEYLLAGGINLPYGTTLVMNCDLSLPQITGTGGTLVVGEGCDPKIGYVNGSIACQGNVHIRGSVIGNVYVEATDAFVEIDGDVKTGDWLLSSPDYSRGPSVLIHGDLVVSDRLVLRSVDLTVEGTCKINSETGQYCNLDLEGSNLNCNGDFEYTGDYQKMELNDDDVPSNIVFGGDVTLVDARWCHITHVPGDLILLDNTRFEGSLRVGGDLRIENPNSGTELHGSVEGDCFIGEGSVFHDVRLSIGGNLTHCGVAAGGGYEYNNGMIDVKGNVDLHLTPPAGESVARVQGIRLSGGTMEHPQIVTADPSVMFGTLRYYDCVASFPNGLDFEALYADCDNDEYADDVNSTLTIVGDLPCFRGGLQASGSVVIEESVEDFSMPIEPGRAYSPVSAIHVKGDVRLTSELYLGGKDEEDEGAGEACPSGKFRVDGTLTVPDGIRFYVCRGNNKYYISNTGVEPTLLTADYYGTLVVEGSGSAEIITDLLYLNDIVAKDSGAVKTIVNELHFRCLEQDGPNSTVIFSDYEGTKAYCSGKEIVCNQNTNIWINLVLESEEGVQTIRGVGNPEDLNVQLESLAVESEGVCLEVPVWAFESLTSSKETIRIEGRVDWLQTYVQQNEQGYPRVVQYRDATGLEVLFDLDEKAEIWNVMSIEPTDDGYVYDADLEMDQRDLSEDELANFLADTVKVRYIVDIWAPVKYYRQGSMLMFEHAPDSVEAPEGSDGGLLTTMYANYSCTESFDMLSGRADHDFVLFYQPSNWYEDEYADPIDPSDLANGSFELDRYVYVGDDNPVNLELSYAQVYDGESYTSIDLGTHFDFYYVDADGFEHDGAPSELGTYNIGIRAVDGGGYTGKSHPERTIMIVAENDLALASVSTDSYTYRYTGAAVVPPLEITMGGVELHEGVDYEVSYRMYDESEGWVDLEGLPTQPGEYQVIVTAIGAYTGTNDCEYTGYDDCNFVIVDPHDLRFAYYGEGQHEFAYTGKPVAPKPKVYDYDGNELTEGVHFEYCYTNMESWEPIAAADSVEVGDYFVQAVAIEESGYRGSSDGYEYHIANGDPGGPGSGGGDGPDNPGGSGGEGASQGGSSGGSSPSASTPIAKKANPMTVKAKTIKAKKGKKTVVKPSKAFTVKDAQGKVTYKVAKYSKAKKKITVSSSGKVTVKKGVKKGTYKLTIAVTAAGNANYKPVTKTITLKVKVK